MGTVVLANVLFVLAFFALCILISFVARNRISLEGKRVFLTGAGDERGLGAKFAKALVDRGATVFLVDINPNVRSVAANLGERACAHVADTTDLVQMQVAAEVAVHWMGDIDIVIANAGKADVTTLENDPERYRSVCAVNEQGTYNTIYACKPFIKGEGKFVLSNASNGGIVPLMLMGAYNASKAHVIKLAEWCNLELIGTGARSGVLLLSEHTSPMEDNFKKPIPGLLMKTNRLLGFGHKERDPKHAVKGMLRAIRGRRLYTSVPRYSALARYFPAHVGWTARQMHRNIQPVVDASRFEYESSQ